MQAPVGPVAVSGASNLRLAFFSRRRRRVGRRALPPLPARARVAEAMRAAAVCCRMHPREFFLIQGGKRDLGTALVTRSLIKAGRFIGSPAGARRSIFAPARPQPIRIFGTARLGQPDVLGGRPPGRVADHGRGTVPRPSRHLGGDRRA
ncbi:MAG: NADP-dependent aldehyde dehydrogenase [Paracoccaceae bacterium]|jgi:NADP-dependent aldehyde dehydrogenase